MALVSQDLMFFRSGPAVFRCLYNWLYWSSHGQHDPGEKPLDHFTWRTVIQVARGGAALLRGITLCGDAGMLGRVWQTGGGRGRCSVREARLRGWGLFTRLRA